MFSFNQNVQRIGHLVTHYQAIVMCPIWRDTMLSLSLQLTFFYQPHCSREFSTLNLGINAPIYPFHVPKTTRALRNPLFLLLLQLSRSQSWRPTVLIRSKGLKASEASAGILLRAKNSRSSNHSLHPKTVIAQSMLFSRRQQCRLLFIMILAWSNLPSSLPSYFIFCCCEEHHVPNQPRRESLHSTPPHLGNAKQGLKAGTWSEN